MILKVSIDLFEQRPLSASVLATDEIVQNRYSWTRELHNRRCIQTVTPQTISLLRSRIVHLSLRRRG